MNASVVELMPRIGERAVARIRAATTREELAVVLEDLGSHARPALVWMLARHATGDKEMYSKQLFEFLGFPEDFIKMMT